MNKLDMESKNIVNDNIEYIRKKFTNVVVESGNGYEIDFDLLKQEFSNIIIDEKKEKYQLTWPGKKACIVQGNTITTNTLRPIMDKSKKFNDTKNIYIEGDNLEALKILQESYLNKIDCIYIDPPYNTGNDFIYNDKFSKNSDNELVDSGQISDDGNRLVSNSQSNGRFHSNWLSMMYPRLKLARNLLSDKGFIAVSLDWNENDNVIKLLSEIFGERNFIASIPILSNPRGRQSSSFVAETHEYCTIFAKNIAKCKVNGDELTDEQKKEYKFEDENGNYRLLGLRLRGGRATAAESPTLHFPIYYDIKNNQFDVERMNDSDYEIIPKFEDGTLGTWRWSKEKIKKDKKNLIVKPVKDRYDVFQKDYLTDDKRMKPKSLWCEKEINYDRSKDELKALGMGKYFDYAKPLYLMRKIINMLSNKNSIIMDFFSGSATTAQAVIEMNMKDSGNRQFIMVQLPEVTADKSDAKNDGFNNICEIGEERIRRVGNSINESLNKQLDVGFRVFKVDSSNMKDVYYKPSGISQMNLLDYMSNIKEDRGPEDLLTQVMLDLGLTLDLKIEEKTILNNKVFYVDNNSLIACFDDQIDINIVDEICKCSPMKVVFKDSSFKTDKDKINLEERIKKLSPDTEVSVL